MNINCANLTSEDYKKLKNKFGEDKANYLWNKLNGEIPEDINTLVDVKFKKAQILMPYKIKKILEDNGIDITKLTHEQLRNMIDDDVLEGLSYRIPNQAAASNDAFEVVGILPENVGDTIIAFKEITTKTGSDFDIDKAYVMLPNFHYNPKTRRIQTIKDDSKEGLQNRRLKISNLMLSNPKKYPQSMKPLDTDWLKTLILGNSKKKIEPLIKEDKQVEDLNFYTGTNQVFVKSTFDNTKTLVGPIAKNITNHNAIKHEGITYNNTYLGKGIYKTIEEETTIVENPIVNIPKEPTIVTSGENKFSYDGKTIDTEFQLTQGQEKVLKQLIDFSKSSDKFITLQGYAGTGKTTTIGYLAKYLNDKKFLYTAPTHAATAELAFATVKTGNKEFPMTIASSIKTAKNKFTGQEETTFTKKFSDRLSYMGNILVVDELSMLSAKDLKGLQKALKTNSNIKVIFMGDPLQIPEVNVTNPEYKQISKAFSAVKQVKLNEIKRTSDNDILNVLSNLRKNPDGSIPKVENTDKLKYLNSQEFNELLIDKFKTEPENTVLISYTNSGVAHSNQKIRESLGYTGSPKIGEVVTGYLGYSSKQVEKGNVANSIRYVISDIEKKDSAYIINFTSNKLKNLADLEIKGIKEKATTTFLQLSTSDSFNFEDLTEKDYSNNNKEISQWMEKLYDAKQKALKNSRLWDNYYRVHQSVSGYFQNVNLGNTYIYNPQSKQMELYVYDLHKDIDADLQVKKGIDYGYAVTVHKSQGSTIKNVFYDTNTLPNNSGSKLLNDKEEVGTEKGSLNYVAMSRASDLLVIKSDDKSLFYPAENLLKDKKEESKQEDKTITNNPKEFINYSGAAEGSDFDKKNIFTVKPIQAVDKKAVVKASIATQFIGFAEGIAGSSTELYRQQVLEQEKSNIDFQVENSGSTTREMYLNRTAKNASADATLDFGLNQEGESWTKRAVIKNNKKYIGINTNNLTVTDEIVNKIVEQLNNVKAKSLNIAGMGIYNMKSVTQEQVDNYVYQLLNNVINSPNLKTKIESIRTGGQTGFDEAGAKAGQRLGIKTLILAPKGFTFRNKDGKDISNEQQFINRFKTKLANSGNYSSNDVIFVSVGGKRGNEATRKTQQDRTIREAIKALEAGATLITDNAAYVESNSYNEGEKRLAANLKDKGYNYSETTVDGNLLGVWNKKSTETKPRVSELFESNPKLANSVYEALGFGQEGINYYEGNITPEPNTVFVFGSNPEGRHGAGAAKIARDKFGAVYGQGEGLQGNAYALPTKDLRVKENRGFKSISPEQITNSIKKLYEVAKQNPNKQFKVAYRNTTDTSLNGYTGLEMIEMFNNAAQIGIGYIPSNVIFSKEWFDTGLLNNTQQSNTQKPTQQSNKRTITTSKKESLVSTDIDEDGNSVEETLTGYMNAIVDGVKDPYIVKGNINLFTGGIAFMLARAGVSRNWITTFMVQPIIVDLVKQMNISESRISEISRDEKNETIKALDVILKKYGSNLTGPEFKEQISKDNLKNENGEINITTEELKLELDNPNQNTQLKVLKQFFEFQNVSFRLSELMTIMSADTDGVTKNDITATMRDNLMYAVINNNTFTGLEKVLGYSKLDNGEIEFDNSRYIGTFHKNSVQFFKKLCKQQFVTSSDSFKHASYTIANYAGYSKLTNKKHEEILTLIEQELFASFVEESKILSFANMVELEVVVNGPGKQIRKINNEMARNIFLLNQKLSETEGRLLTDNERKTAMMPYLEKINFLKSQKSLAERVQDAKIKYPDNVFIQSLFADVNPYNNGKPSTVGLNTKNLNKDAKNVLYLYWEDLLNKDEKLAEDLIKYSFYTSGLSNNFGAFFEHIPTNWLVKKGLNDFMIEKLQTLNESNSQLLHLQKQVMRHLAKDDRIVPVISDKITTEFKTSDNTIIQKQYYLTIPEFNSKNLEIGTNNEDEKEYKTYIKRIIYDKDNDTKKNIMYELQGYINTKDSMGKSIKTLLYRAISSLGTKTKLGYVREYGNNGPSIFSDNAVLIPNNISNFVNNLKKTDPKPIQILNSPVDDSFKRDDEIDENDPIFCAI